MDFQWWNFKKRVIVCLCVLIVVVVGILVYFLLASRVELCGDYNCFSSNMVHCSQATYTNDAPQATWQYDILGHQGANCAIDVTMLQEKNGSTGLDGLNGETMTCYYPYGVTGYPGSDLSYCHGRLKEDMQGVIISKLHTLLADNLDNLKKT